MLAHAPAALLCSTRITSLPLRTRISHHHTASMLPQVTEREIIKGLDDEDDF